MPVVHSLCNMTHVKVEPDGSYGSTSDVKPPLASETRQWAAVKPEQGMMEVKQETVEEQQETEDVRQDLVKEAMKQHMFAFLTGARNRAEEDEEAYRQSLKHQKEPPKEMTTDDPERKNFVEFTFRPLFFSENRCSKTKQRPSSMLVQFSLEILLLCNKKVPTNK